MEFLRNIIFVFEIDNSFEPKFSWTAMGEVLKWRMDRLALEMCQQCLGRESRGWVVWPGSRGGTTWPGNSAGDLFGMVK